MNLLARSKVGIITYYFGKNYGSVLQAYALQEMIKDQGYDVSIIDYQDMSCELSKKWRVHYYFNVLTTVVRYPSQLKPFLRSKKKTADGSRKLPKDVFRDFIKENLELYQFASSNQINEFDSYVCGSDQIWGLSLPGLNYTTFLRFCDKQKRIAYAPSFGLDEVPYYNRKQLVKYLSEFSCLSVREISAKKLIEKLTSKTPTLVLDPVLLAGAEFWQKRIGVSSYSNCIVCYFLDSSNEAKRHLTKKLLSEKRTVVWIETGVEAFETSYIRISPTPLEYVSLISAASQVYTDSFHGTAFSIMMHTPFTVFKRNYGENPGQQTRIDSLLEITQMKDRLYEDSLHDNNRQVKSDFAAADISLKELRTVSIKYLCDSLKHHNKIGDN